MGRRNRPVGLIVRELRPWPRHAGWQGFGQDSQGQQPLSRRGDREKLKPCGGREGSRACMGNGHAPCGPVLEMHVFPKCYMLHWIGFG